MRRLPLVATLSALASVVVGVDYTGGVQDRIPRNLSDNGRRVYLTGLVDLDAVKVNNATDGNNKRSDMRSEGWGRAELGSRVVLNDRVEVGVSVGYVSQAGNNRPLGYDSEYPPAVGTVNSPEANAENGYHSSGDMTLAEAFVRLPNFLGMRQLDVLVGRQSMAMNLRKGRPAWLFDSRSQNRPVTRWDGVHAKYDLGFLDMDADVFAFRLPDDSGMFGLMGDWKVLDKSDLPLWVTGNYVYQTEAKLNDGTVVDNLRTAYVGIDLDLGTFELYGEYALQRGSVGNGTDVSFHGWGINAGIDWRVVKNAQQEYIIGVSYERLSGDDNPADDQYDAFVNTWEATSDTYLMEHEKYGQITRLVQGNLSDWKVRLEYSLLGRVRIAGVWGRYQLVVPPAGSDDGLGNEYDLTISWDYDGNTRSPEKSGGCTFSLFGGMFKPNAGYEDLRRFQGFADAGTDPMWIMGANVLAKF